MMNYMEFSNTIKAQLQQRMDDSKKVNIHKITKTNIGELDALIILEDNRNVSPNFYVNKLFDEYQNGSKVDEIVSDVIKKYDELMDEDEPEIVNGLLFTDFAKIKDKIYFKLINSSRNRGLLENVVNVDLLDMSLVFAIIVTEDEDGMGSVMITKYLFERWNISASELYSIAKENTEKLLPVQINTMTYMLRKLVGEAEWEMMSKSGMLPDDEALCMTGFSEPLVITNKNGINGFTTVLYKGVLKELAEKLESNLIILPSSIHEGIILQDDDKTNIEDIKAMVREVNESCVSPEEYLSDEVISMTDVKTVYQFIMKG